MDIMDSSHCQTGRRPKQCREPVSHLFLSAAVCAFAASGVLAAQTIKAGAQQNDPDLIVYHTGALSLAKSDGVDAVLKNSSTIDLSKVRVGTAMGAQAVRVLSFGSGYPRPGGPAGDISITQSGALTSSNTAGDPIANTSAVVYANSRGGEGLSADHEEKRHAGNGGSGGDITINNSGNIVSNVEQTYGIHAVSYGGTGGDQDTHSSKYPAGLGGKGGRVTLINRGDVTTTEADAAAIVLQSLGGPSGLDLTHSDLKSGGAVSLTLQNKASGAASTLSTQGERSAGIVAQSVGGGDITYDLDNGAPRPVSGGKGGTVTVDLGANNIVTTGGLSHGAVLQSIGGSSGLSPKGKPGTHGGNASTVNVKAASGSRISTAGINSDGLLLQSIGGSGGAGGFDTGSVAIGGDGGDGGHGGTVDLTMPGRVDTKGDHSLGVLALSLGGGGGRGGNADAKGVFTALAIGGNGGDGGHGGTIGISVNDIATEGLFSHAVSALSIGGGGGHGGTATARATAPILASATAIGGSGGKGGHGGSIEINADGQIKTSGAHSFGVLASSIGGGGGNGGAAHSLSASAGPVSFSVSVAVGGHGGSGGNAGSVTLGQKTGGSIATEGDFSIGLAALSLGGGGGAGGNAQSLAASVAAGEGAISGSVAVAVGGKGGDGGDGNAITLTSNGGISTKGAFALGIHALSAGGGGGHGGSSTALSVALSTGMSASVSVAVGGSGGKGGSAGNMTIDLGTGSRVLTLGDHAAGLVVQSIGGGGGTGGNAVSLSASIGAQGNGNTISVGVGGTGGSGGDGGRATVGSSGFVSTKGHLSHAILAQSIGGGGGSGGNSISAAAAGGAKAARSLVTSVGGNGKSAGHGDEVKVDTSGLISTEGQFAIGVAAQSIGGSGGIGGNSESANAAISTGQEEGEPTKAPGGKAVTVSVGGNGGDGGHGGAVSIINGSALTTQGATSIGLMAQSIGGGGGAGGHTDSIFITGTSKTPVDDNGTGFSLSHIKSLELALGGNGGDGGNGGKVDILHRYRTLTTYGDGAAAILGQSIGGGGGIAAAADHVAFVKSGRVGGHSTAGNGTDVKVTTASSISTYGMFASGIIAQSIGGGGGAVLSSENLRDRFLETNDLAAQKGEVSLGGALTAGKGGRVTIDSGGDIETSGNYAAGIIAQSIGGGGGLATIDNADSPTKVSVFAQLKPDDNSQNGASEVTVSQSGAIETSGIGAMGILVQSIGGGGGLVQAASSVVDETALIASLAALTGNTGGADGGKVSVTQEADALIHTTGAGAVGILAQSIGGTGGLVQQQDGQLAIHNHKTAGKGGDLHIEQGGILKTEGLYADGILARTYGSEGPGNINITVNGTVQTLGDNVAAITASAAGAGKTSSDIQISVSKGGRVEAKGAHGNAVVIHDTTVGFLKMAKVSNSGSISSQDGLAISSNQYAHISNDGVISGDIDVTGARKNLAFFGVAEVHLNAEGNLTNTSSGTIESGDNIKLGTYRANEKIYGLHVGLFDNSGTLSPGGAGQIGSTALSGRYESSATARYAVDLDLNLGRSDHFSASQGARVEGVIEPRILSFGSQAEVQILSVPKAADLSFSAKAAANPVVDYTVKKVVTGSGDHAVNLTVGKIDFNAHGLSSNQAAIARKFNERLAGGLSDTDSDLLALANAGTLAQLSHLLGSYSDTHSAKQTASLQSGATHFTGSVFSCGVARGPHAAIAETECDWAEAGYRWTSHDGNAGSAARDDRLYNIGLGVQRDIAENWSMGVAGGYGVLDSSSALAASRANLVQAGMVFKYQKDSLLLGGSIAVGHSWQDMVRAIPLSPGLQAASSTQSHWVHSRLRAGYLFENEDWFAKPLADVDLNFTHTGGYSETGAGSYNLSVLPVDDFRATIAAGMEIGRSLELDSGLSVRAYGYGGVRYNLDNTTATQVVFSGISSAVTQISEHDRTLGEVAAGLKFFGESGMGIDLRYDGAFGASTTSQSVKAKVRWRF
ncbi:hypothetical protein [Hoeflea sp.]|uniref:hypothetical protein n=1 Tax=Hoeflea sp. TaxID=1940281 RepID=UPI003B51E57F